MSKRERTAFPAVRLGGDRRHASDVFRRRYAIAFERGGVTPAQLRFWRERFMFVSVEVLAQLLRVSGRTIRHWEAGKSRIPFSVWWVMTVTISDPELKIARGCFDQFYVGIEGGEARLMHEQWLNISWSEKELLQLAAQAGRVPVLQRELDASNEAIARLQVENTELRRLFKSKGVVTELGEMQKRIASLLDRIETADVIEFPQSLKEKAA